MSGQIGILEHIAVSGFLYPRSETAQSPRPQGGAASEAIALGLSIL